MTNHIVTEIRDAAVDCQDELIRYNLNLIATELDDALGALARHPSIENLQRVTGHHAHGQLMIGHSKNKRSTTACPTTTQPKPHVTAVSRAPAPIA